MKACRTAIFGGSFNPVHNGHIALARQVIGEGMADEVWLMVSPHNPLKQRVDLLNEQARYELAYEALRNEPHILASDFEFRLPRPSYTWNTLQALVAAFPQREFALLIGADNWLLFDHWAHSEDIVNNYPIIVYPRTGYEIPESYKLPSTVKVLCHAPCFPFSSTDVRHAVKTGQSIDTLVPQHIAERVERLYSTY